MLRMFVCKFKFGISRFHLHIRHFCYLPSPIYIDIPKTKSIESIHDWKRKVFGIKTNISEVKFPLLCI